jgi:hypothetical protein
MSWILEKAIMDTEWTPITSTSVAAMKYREKLRVLEIKFKNNQVYQYDNVDKELVQNLLQAKSFGSTFHHLIKVNPALYPCRALL